MESVAMFFGWKNERRDAFGGDGKPIPAKRVPTRVGTRLGETIFRLLKTRCNMCFSFL